MTQLTEVQVEHQFDTQLWEKIQGLDLVRVRNRLIIKEGYTADDADATIAEYRQYLYIAGKIGNVAPGADCDDAWHAHMLHMPMYFRDCLYLYGCILWDVPNDTIEMEVLQALETPRRKKRTLLPVAVCENSDPDACKNNCYEGMTPIVGTDCEAIQASIRSHFTVQITVPKNEYALHEGVETKSFYQLCEEIFG